ncbi:hypothetical protein [Pseudomonas sp. R16(2017)]|uniref:hypothetical protein n=1 Tax=Pseudomonas sp. R16(2017) TaxID=1981704 RepID=UPI000A1E61CE|nr:hypothetical protein [Pseudomonas sp. R16(2017)]
MKLRDPFLNEIFEPSLMWFIDVFDIYDREETLGQELEIYNPNDESDREILITKYSLNMSYLSYRHKFMLIHNLRKKLDIKDYNFRTVFEINEDEAASWPREEWYGLESVRAFFQEIHNLAQTVWASDLEKATAEDRTTWQ